MVKSFFLVFFVSFFLSCGPNPEQSEVKDFHKAKFPLGPNAKLTPGSLCTHPDSYRYPEHIPYCNRDVDFLVKHMIFVNYDKMLGFKVQQMNRDDFKIDHYIPLCMGGSNSPNNLWPQYKTIYPQTDPIEEKLCELMARGRMKQIEAVKLIKGVKNNLDTAAKLNQELDRKLKGN